VTNAPRNKGTAWETACVRYLAERGLPARRKPLAGSQDKGDIEMDGVPDILIEAKNAKRTTLAEWMDQAVAEAVNAGVRICAVWHHRRLAASPGGGYVTMTGEHFTEVLLDLKALRCLADALEQRRDALKYASVHDQPMSERAVGQLYLLEELIPAHVEDYGGPEE